MSNILRMNPWKKKSDDFSYTLSKRFNMILDYIKNDISTEMNVLDIGQKSPFTKFLEQKLDINIYNTKGDLDSSFFIPPQIYDMVIYSHTIEHQFNPLYTLLKIKEFLSEENLLYIILPQRPKFLWTKHHFHEIDDYRMNLLANRANYNILEKKSFIIRRNLKFHLSGIRPFLRLFLNKQTIYKLTDVQRH